MVLMVLETEALSDAVLPVAQLAAQMRLPEGYDAVPGQEARLLLCLRAAIASLERRLGRILLSRAVVLGGDWTGDGRVPLPVGPIASVLAVTEMRNGVAVEITGGRVEADARSPVLVLPRAAFVQARLTVTVQAGWADWAAIPGPLAQAALLTAEALDRGGEGSAPGLVEGLIAPWRVRRIGGAC